VAPKSIQKHQKTKLRTVVCTVRMQKAEVALPIRINSLVKLGCLPLFGRGRRQVLSLRRGGLPFHEDPATRL
jgi:hypothetical protein